MAENVKYIYYKDDFYDAVLVRKEGYTYLERFDLYEKKWVHAPDMFYRLEDDLSRISEAEAMEKLEWLKNTDFPAPEEDEWDDEEE